MYAQGPDKDEWFISANSILYVKDSCTLEYDLPNGISTIARQIGFMGKDFLHLACREAMLSFALRQNSADLDNNVLAVSDKGQETPFSLLPMIFVYICISLSIIIRNSNQSL